jgi:hypothetical protein
VTATRRANGPCTVYVMTTDEHLPAPQPVKWDDSHKRWTFWVPLDVFEAIGVEAARTGRTKTAVVVTLLREGLHV